MSFFHVRKREREREGKERGGGIEFPPSLSIFHCLLSREEKKRRGEEKNRKGEEEETRGEEEERNLLKPLKRRGEEKKDKVAATTIGEPKR